ncbi:hypothetical protein HPB47_018706 [Ixodes persulcatus]|uniref:Uncharacterized protein n=1 Tax=Ixodes persulcatus TaxID=34615 RepID=A0AC60QK04_IXOPE|nr:hypothetical protein HPB47_018706 [Ixodes persulcatus]
MLRRVSTSSRGLKERSMMRLCDALLISRLRYHLPYTKLTQRQKMKLDALIRKRIKLAMGLPITTSTHRLLDMGYNNTVDELVAIHTRRQEIRLLLSPQGRHILTQLGHNASSSPPPKEATVRTTTRTAIAVTDHHFSTIHTAVLPPMNPCLAELHAIAAAITLTSGGSFTSSIPIIFTDPMATCQRLIHSSLPLAIAEQIERKLLSPVGVVWIPGHGVMPDNEKAHQLTRETLHRTPDIPRSAQTFPAALASLKSYRQARRAPFSATPKVTPVPTPARIHLLRSLIPEDPPPCIHCGDRPNTHHILWICHPPPPRLPNPISLSFPPNREWLTTATRLSDQVYMAMYIQYSLEYTTRGGLD